MIQSRYLTGVCRIDEGIAAESLQVSDSTTSEKNLALALRKGCELYLVVIQSSLVPLALLAEMLSGSDGARC